MRRYFVPVSFFAVLAACAAHGGGDAASTSVAAATAETCPDLANGETTQDCPWAGIARDLIAAKEPAAELRVRAPAIADALAANAQHPELIDLWGRALNFNALPDGGVSVDPIVVPAVHDALAGLMGAPARKDSIVHAGVQHTYGYLFSVLQTPYGFKRARWVAPDVTRGFGLPDGTLGPTPANATLFANVTYLAGMIAFDGEAERATLAADTALVSPSILALDRTTLQIQRLTETVTTNRQVDMRTDFVKFPAATGTANTYWLVYSIHDAAYGRSRLITAFPINDGSFTTPTAAPLLGDNQPIVTLYNAWVDGVTGPAISGSRTLAPRQLTH